MLCKEVKCKILSVQNTKVWVFSPGSSRPWLCCASHWTWLWWLSTAASCPKLCWRWTSTNSRYVIYKKLKAPKVKPRDPRIGSNKLGPYLCYLLLLRFVCCAPPPTFLDQATEGLMRTSSVGATSKMDGCL